MFKDYKDKAEQYITFIESELYPDYLDHAKVYYGPILKEFKELTNQSQDSKELLVNISKEKNPMRTQLLRIFRKNVSPNTSVEMLKKKTKIPKIIEDFGHMFRDIKEVRKRMKSRPEPDETLAALLYEYKDRGQKGYELTEAFFLWFEERFDDIYEIIGPRRAGKDVMLSDTLKNFHVNIPADFLVYRKSDKAPLIVGFARYDSDRGGSQEDDRTGGNRDKITEIKRYAQQENVPLKILFVNDGPGLLLGSMWNDYSELETYGKGSSMVCTLKMLDERLTQDWIES